MYLSQDDVHSRFFATPLTKFALIIILINTHHHLTYREAETYKNVEVKFISGKKAILTTYEGEGESEENWEMKGAY